MCSYYNLQRRLDNKIDSTQFTTARSKVPSNELSISEGKSNVASNEEIATPIANEIRVPGSIECVEEIIKNIE